MINSTGIASIVYKFKQEIFNVFFFEKDCAYFSVEDKPHIESVWLLSLIMQDHSSIQQCSCK